VNCLKKKTEWSQEFVGSEEELKKQEDCHEYEYEDTEIDDASFVSLKASFIPTDCPSEIINYYVDDEDDECFYIR
jgi:hypothetical protein